MKTIFIKTCRQIMAVFVAVAMLFSTTKIPVAYAYFTAKGESAVLTFDIKKAGIQITAFTTFINAFLFNNEEESINGEGKHAASSYGAGILSPGANPAINTPGAATLEALFGRDRGSMDEKLARVRKIQVEIRLEEGFEVAAIDIPSIEIHHGENSVHALAGRFDGDDILVVDFDRDIIAGWFKEADTRSEYAYFVVTGEGYPAGAERFIFSSEASLLLKGSYQTKLVEIDGAAALFIPGPGNTTIEAYALVNQDQTRVTGGRWALENAAVLQGVEIDSKTGLLTIYTNSFPESVHIIAVIDLEGRTLVARKTVELYRMPQFSISGADTITIPLPYENSREQYAIQSSDSNTLTDVRWGLSEEVSGVGVDENGLVTVTGETAVDSFTLTALLTVGLKETNVPLTVKKQISLETVEVGSIEVLGAESILIPEGELFRQNYQALVFDPQGNELQGEPVTWTIENIAGNSSGISLSEEGSLVVETYAVAGEITIAATAVRNNEISGSKTVNLAEQYQENIVPPPGPLPEEKGKLFIEGRTLILIPPGEETKTFAYLATDYQSKSLENVFFSLQAEYTGVNLHENGALTIDASAAEGDIVLLASLLEEQDAAEETESPSLTGELTVTLALPAPSAIQVEGPVTLEIPPVVNDNDDEETPPETRAGYTAKVFDQEDSLLANAGVIWSLWEAVEGVTLSDTGELTVTQAAKAGTITIMAVSLDNDEVTGFLEIELLAGAESPAEDTPPGREEDPPALEELPKEGTGGGGGGNDGDGDSDMTGTDIDDNSSTGDEDAENSNEDAGYTDQEDTAGNHDHVNTDDEAIIDNNDHNPDDSAHDQNDSDSGDAAGKDEEDAGSNGEDLQNSDNDEPSDEPSDELPDGLPEEQPDEVSKDTDEGNAAGVAANATAGEDGEDNEQQDRDQGGSQKQDDYQDDYAVSPENEETPAAEDTADSGD